MVVAVAFSACSNEEETFSFDENGVPVAVGQQRISEEQFSAMIDGAGWVDTKSMPMAISISVTLGTVWKEWQAPVVSLSMETKSVSIFLSSNCQRWDAM